MMITSPGTRKADGRSRIDPGIDSVIACVLPTEREVDVNTGVVHLWSVAIPPGEGYRAKEACNNAFDGQ